MRAGPRRRQLESFDFAPGRIITRKYEIISRLGAGWEGEVYRVRECATGIVRAAKFFFPHRNLREKTSRFYAKKLHKLRNCSILIRYHTQETIRIRGHQVTFLVSDLVEGELLSTFTARRPGRKLPALEGLLLLHALASGMARIHDMGEYHGDLHDDNVIVRRFGLGFHVRLLDLFHWTAPKRSNIQDDVCDLIRLFYDAIGGRKHYGKQPALVKDVACGLKRSLILRKFRTAGQLRDYLETLEWD